jgi:uncharacterized membrane protein
MEQNRFRSYLLWASILALASMFLNDIGLVQSTVFDVYAEKILYILIAAGVINNPTKKDKL